MRIGYGFSFSNYSVSVLERGGCTSFKLYELYSGSHHTYIIESSADVYEEVILSNVVSNGLVDIFI